MPGWLRGLAHADDQPSDDAYGASGGIHDRRWFLHSVAPDLREPRLPDFKVDVEFEAVGRPDRDTDGRVTMVEGAQDRIIKISRPYLQFSVID